MPSIGCLFVGIEGKMPTKEIYINTEYINNLPAIVIKDNGTGFPQGDRAELFKPFVTTKPMGVGMGLGLYYVKQRWKP